MRRHPVTRFLIHYGEMVLVMIAGMVVLGVPLVLVAAALGAGPAELERNAPAAVLLGMGLAMTAPMVWWMRRRGHSLRATRVMVVAMVIPTLGALGLLATGASGDLGALLGLQHVAMFPAMLAAMLLHTREYTHAAFGARDERSFR